MNPLDNQSRHPPLPRPCIFPEDILCTDRHRVPSNPACTSSLFWLRLLLVILFLYINQHWGYGDSLKYWISQGMPPNQRK